ncbi:MAG TPA: chemotaxis protein CheA [Verrucomicrobiae bacterium]|nr:chemotaxis protein CheA [Verrucomicrobiae bacterium]
MDDLIKEFLVESIENLDRLDSELVKLETDPSSQELLSSIFRTIHTIKGSCGFLGFSKLEKVAHVGESLLSRLRDGKLSLTPEFTSGLLAMVDAIRTMLGEIQTTGQDGNETYPDLIETLNKLQNQGQEPSSKAAAEASLPKEPPKKQKSDSPKENSAKSIPPDSVPAQPERALPAQPEPPAPSAAAPGETSPAQHPTDDSRSRNAAAETIRVDVHLLDRLMNLVGELVLTRNQITQFSARQSDPNLVSPAQQLNLLTSELQEEVMRTRMQPISKVFDKFPRVVRDVATARGKQVLIEMEGKETELDRSLLEAIKDPLTHIVRNSVDHGIEMPEERVARGKRPEGRLVLRACHEGGQVLVEISDDGAGIDTARVKSKAIERGVITAQQAARMSEGELLNLVFLPGFSTAEKVTNLSGRGVGMDVVKTNIDRVNGTVDLQSYPGKGTTIKIKIPLTLAIVRAVIIQSKGKRFAIPQVNIQELVRLEADRVRTDIESVHGVPVYRMRGRLLPLIYLSEELKLAKKTANQDELDEATNIVVLQANDHPFGLVVDEINDSEEIVVKPLSRHLRALKIFAGATIMGDGKVALILDVVGLAQNANIFSEARDQALAEKTAEVLASQDQNQAEKQTFLLFAGPDDARMALPLSTVARLEEFRASDVEKSGGEWVIQYRGKILPLIRLDVVLEERRSRLRHGNKTVEPDPLQVLVCNNEGRTIGIIVERILDIVEDRADVKSPATREGILCAVVINDRVTELIDIPVIQRIAEENRTLSTEHAEVID